MFALRNWGRISIRITTKSNIPREDLSFLENDCSKQPYLHREPPGQDDPDPHVAHWIRIVLTYMQLDNRFFHLEQ